MRYLQEKLRLVMSLLLVAIVSTCSVAVASTKSSQTSGPTFAQALNYGKAATSSIAKEAYHNLGVYHQVYRYCANVALVGATARSYGKVDDEFKRFNAVLAVALAKAYTANKPEDVKWIRKTLDGVAEASAATAALPEIVATKLNQRCILTLLPKQAT